MNANRGLQMDKCTELYSMRIPEVLKVHLDKLTSREKNRLKQKLMLDMAKAVHESRFDPDTYLSSNS